jgi:hypothetical protein
MNKQNWYVHTMEYFSAIKGHTTTWMDLENVIIGENKHKRPHIGAGSVAQVVELLLSKHEALNSFQHHHCGISFT